MGERIKEGYYRRFGVTRYDDGICFTFQGEMEDECAVRLYDKHRGSCRDYPVPKEYCVGAVRSVCIGGIDEKRYDYNYVINGEVVVDPYARRIVGREKWADAARRQENYEIRCGFDFDEFDWRGDHCPQIPGEDMVMYKLHVRGFTKDAPGRGAKKGTFAALAEKIPYLKDLGVTTIELMPAYEFEELIPPKHEETVMDFEGWVPQAVAGYRMMQRRQYEEKQKEPPRINYWGYGPGDYFAPKAGYAAGRSPSAEFKEMVRSLHEAGMECVMEMSFDGRENPNHVIEILRHWVVEYHVDGFHLLCSDAVVTSVVCDILLRRTKIFAASFPEEVWKQQSSYPHLYVYNDDFLYIARKLVNHQDGNLVEFMHQQKKQHPQIGFVNYFANNNGFTLSDTFSYASKHNEANDEGGSDGNDWNYSQNCGAEGATRKRAILRERGRLMELAAACTILSQGVPLIYAGDEFGNSQNGNNNAYCQDNRVGWVNWQQLEKRRGFHDEVKELLAIRGEFGCLRSHRPLRMADYEAHGMPDLSYHGSQAWNGDIYPSMQAVGEAYCGAYGGDSEDLYIGWNFSQNGVTLALPRPLRGRKWQVLHGSGVINDENDRMHVPGNCVVLAVAEAEPPEETEPEANAGSAPSRDETASPADETASQAFAEGRAVREASAQSQASADGEKECGKTRKKK